MQCIKCKFESSGASKFCASCESQLFTEDDVKSQSEITLDCLINVFSSLRYNVDEKDCDKTDNCFLACHDEKSNLFIELKQKNLLNYCFGWVVNQKTNYCSKVLLLKCCQ